MTDDLPIVKSIKMVRESDLTYRLRTSADPGMVHEAADRIEKLEATLREIIVHCEVPAPPNAEALKMFARKALEETK